MIAEEARRRILEAGPSEAVSLLVILRRPTLRDVEQATAGARTRAERLDAIVRAYAGPKRRVREEIEKSVDAEVVDLPSQPNLAVTASGDAWRAIAGPGSFLDQDPDVEVAPDLRVHPT